MNCLNCSTILTGNFCHECGQKAADVRFTLKSMVTDFFFSAFHVEKKGLPNTVKSLTIKPGIAIKDVLLGKRLSLYPHFKYLVLMGALVIIFSLRYRFFHNELTQAETGGTDGVFGLLSLSAEQKNYLDGFFRFAEDKATILNIAAIPVFAFFSWAFMARSKYNFAENLILNTFVTAQQLFFLLLLVPLIEVFPMSRQILITIYSIAVILYNIWVYIQFFDGKKSRVIPLAVVSVALAYVYQFPVSFFIYYLYEHFIHDHMHWIPHVYDTL